MSTSNPLAPAQEALALLPIREDLKLYPGPAHRDGSPSWRILDPVRNAFFEIGWLEFELLARWKGHRDAQALIAQVAAETTLSPTEEEVTALSQFLLTNQLLAPSGTLVRQFLGRRAQAGKGSWSQYLLHHYLFFRVPLLRPDAFLGRTVRLVDPLFSPGFVVVLSIVLGLDLYLLNRDWHSFVEAFSQVLNPKGMAYYAIALTLAKVIHELGHAYAAKRYGVRVPAMGLAFLVLWPYLYTDTGETWKLSDRHKQFVVAAAGMAAELALAIFSTLLWALAPEGATKHVLFVLASSSWIMTLAINASPFMRFDGYFLLSDALDFPNLHERSSACARWWLRTTFFRLDEPVPEPTLSSAARGWLIVFAFVTWLYRLVVFLGIAWLVYHIFLKVLGIVLMLIELVWFIVKPVWSEVAYLWERRKALRPALWPALGLFAAVLALVWIGPVSTEVSAPALLHASQEQSVFAPFPGRVIGVDVQPRQQVTKGQVLLTLESADLRTRTQKADVSMSSARAELARAPASVRQQERQAVLEQQLAEALAVKQAVDEEAQRQQLRAGYDGIVQELPADLVPGRWVNPSQLLMRVVSDPHTVIEAFINERQVAVVEPGQLVRFYPALPDLPVMSGRVIAVEKTPLKQLTRPILASLYGGAITADRSANGKGALVVHDALFRVMIEPDSALTSSPMVLRGTVRIETDLRFIVDNFVYRTLSVLIRESGF